MHSTTQYLHMSKIKPGIKKGVFVKQGDIIGYVGSTGLATGPHVCYRFWKNGKQVDPYKQKLPPAEPIKEEDSPVQELSYQELRTRLPSTISDQVVQLIANSKQALLDFAEIRTQQDVDQFNQLYDVTLTLPQEG